MCIKAENIYSEISQILVKITYSCITTLIHIVIIEFSQAHTQCDENKKTIKETFYFSISRNIQFKSASKLNCNRYRCL